MLTSIKKVNIVVHIKQQLTAAGDEDHTRVCSFATQCLHNTIFLCEQLLPHAKDQSSSSQAPGEASHRSSDTTARSAEAPINPSVGLSYPSNGHRGRLGTTKEGSAAEAAEQLAMLSLDRSRASSGEQHMSNHTYTCMHPNMYTNTCINIYMLTYRS